MSSPVNTKRWQKYVRIVRRFDWVIALASIAIFAVTLNYVRDINVRSDFKAMLPEKAPSVVNLNKIEERVRGTDNLIVLVGGSNWTTLKPFVDDYVKNIEEKLSDRVQRIDYNVITLKKFYEDNKYLFIKYDDLNEIHRRLKRKIDHEKLKELPFYIDFGAEEPKFNVDDIESKYKGSTSTYEQYFDDYFTNDKGNLAAIIVWPEQGSVNVDFSIKIIADLKQLAEDMDPKSYDPKLQVAFGGRLRKMILEYNSIIGDILQTSLLVLACVALVVLAYFRRIRMGLLMTLNVAQGTLVAMCFGLLAIGYLTSQTAFLGAIIVGNGIDYSLIMMSRYLEERRDKGESIDESMTMALAHTWRPTLTSTLTTSAAFFALMFTQVKGFSQFGFIGGIGMPLCWISTFFFLPAWLSLTERIWKIKAASSLRGAAATKQPQPLTPSLHSMNEDEALPHTAQKKPPFMYRFSNWILTRNKTILKYGAALVISSVIFAVFYIPNSLEYNFDNLGFKAPYEDTTTWGAYARDQVNEIFGGGSTSPSIVISKDIEQGKEICEAIKQHDIKLGYGYVEKCQTMASFVPERQDEKFVILGNIKHLLDSSTLKFLTDEQMEEVQKFKDAVDLDPITHEDLPYEVSRAFVDKEGNKGVIAFVYPEADLWNGHELIKFAGILREINLPSGEKIESSGQPVILADLLKAVTDEGPKVTMLSLLLVMLLVWINFRRFSETFLVISSLVTGVILLIGFIAFIGIKLNFLNFIALPITFGIGVDYAVNIYQRLRQDNFEDMTYSLSKISSAVIFCSSTTTIGYSVLLISRSQALQTFGMVALMGEIACLIVAVFMLPGIIKRFKDRGLMPFPQKIKIKEILKAAIGK